MSQQWLPPGLITSLPTALPCQWPPPQSLLDPLDTEPQDWLHTLTVPLSPLSQLMFWLPALTTWPLTVKLQTTKLQDTSHAQRKITNDPIQVSKGRAKKISIAKGLPLTIFSHVVMGDISFINAISLILHTQHK